MDKRNQGIAIAEVVLIEAKDSAELEKYKGTLKNKVVVLYRNDTLKQTFTADAKRYTDEELEKMAAATRSRHASKARQGYSSSAA